MQIGVDFGRVNRSVALVVVATISLALPSTAIAGQALNFADWKDEVVKLGLNPQDVVYPFHVTAEMEQWARSRVKNGAHLSAARRLEILQTELFRDESFDYDEHLTLTAEEAFEAGRGNCLAFTVLFVALSRSIGIETSLFNVRHDPEIEKVADLVVVNRHVVAGYRTPNKIHIYDFYVTKDAPYVQHQMIDDVHASAMYHTNLGGADIRAGRTDSARRHLEIATRLAPDWSPGWVNLGVVRFRDGDSQGALEAYEAALAADPDSSSALTNMALVYEQLGLSEESHRSLVAAAQKTKSPFTLVAIADLEMVNGNYERARHHLRKAKWWYGDEPAVWAALSRLALREGNLDKAERYSARAAELRDPEVERGAER